ncbi:DUF4249 family protein [Flammeovirga sp. OC4]|uniref:DUF4249 family protein n=1 Tax=Flammeovirga sp. OC4 TaxID=1382345 RepID=UPI0005C6EE4D|nr:DUF4249 family protein [Flammeovirga sp. OC4]
MKQMLLISILLVFMGCSYDEEIIDIPIKEKRFLAIEAYLTNNRKIEMTVIHNILLTDELVLKPVWYADVNIMTNKKDYPLLNLPYTRSSDQRFINYVSAKEVMFDKGEITLSINYKDSLFLTSETTVLSPIKLDSIYFGSDQRVGFYFERGEDSDYYKTLAYLYVRDSVLVFSKTHYVGKELKRVEINEKIERLIEADSSSFILSKISKDHYLYEQSVRNAYLANIEPTVKADTIYSNIENGKGIFTFFANDTISINYSVKDLKNQTVTHK